METMFKHPADHHEPQRRRTDKPASKPMSVNTPTKTNSSVTTIGPALPASSTTTPETTLSTKGSSASRQPTTVSLADDPGDYNANSGDSSYLEPPQASSTSLPMLGNSPISNIKNEATSKVLPSATRDISTLPGIVPIPTFDDNQVMLPQKIIDKDASESVTGDYEPHLDDIVLNYTDVTENLRKRQGTDVNLPKRKPPKLTAVVSLNCGKGDGTTEFGISISKNGRHARLEVTQEGSEF